MSIEAAIGYLRSAQRVLARSESREGLKYIAEEVLWPVRAQLSGQLQKEYESFLFQLCGVDDSLDERFARMPESEVRAYIGWFRSLCMQVLAAQPSPETATAAAA